MERKNRTKVPSSLKAILSVGTGRMPVRQEATRMRHMRKDMPCRSTVLCGIRRLAAGHFSEKSENGEEIPNEFESRIFE
jgi:hypothetical protein